MLGPPVTPAHDGTRDCPVGVLVSADRYDLSES